MGLLHLRPENIIFQRFNTTLQLKMSLSTLKMKRLLQQAYGCLQLISNAVLVFSRMN